MSKKNIFSKNMKDNSRLDVKIMQRMYKFGGLAVYRISYFDTVSFKVISLPFTFNEKMAEAIVESYKKSGFAVTLTTEIVKFDGAFSK